MPLRGTVSERFWKKVNQLGDDKCWEWTGSLDTRGYGLLRVNGKLQKAHRVSYVLHIGDIPDGLVICHKCDNTKCVNPNHLFSGTMQDNVDDRDAKGRCIHPHGEEIPWSKLTEDDVREMRLLYNSKQMILRELSEKYKVSIAQIHKAIKGITWKHVI